jgi:DNA-binding response OmpR family regulator
MARLLLVDDERDIRHLFAAELEDEGYQVETAASVAEAEEALGRTSFDLMILDVQMPGESGLQLLQRLASARRLLPVILCTAYSSYKDDFSSWIADGYVVKSSDFSELKSEVARVLAKNQSQ